MATGPRVSVGQYSHKGRKETNQDFHGICIPNEPLLSSKGIAIAIADGISSSDVSHLASESAVAAFLEDYFCTSEAWSVKTSAQRVLMATNSWLHSQTQQSQFRFDKDRGYVCTLSAMVIKSTTAHLFHVGDARIYKLHDNALEQLTHDHRLWVSPDTSYLSRAMGIDLRLEIDYHALSINEGDIFLLATDGVYEHVSPQHLLSAIHEHADDLDLAARRIVNDAYERGSTDNLTAQIVRIETLPDPDVSEISEQVTLLPFLPDLDARVEIDGYRILREVHASHRSHIYLAVDAETNTQVIIKAPSTDLRGDPARLERFLMEEWIATRINSAHVLKPCRQTRKRNFLYVAMEHIEGQTLTQWMSDNPKPKLETVRSIIEQIAKGLRAFHRLEMLHQDLRPENIMIDDTGTLKIIDFGSTSVAGIMEITTSIEHHPLQGTVQYAAPEYFLGENGSTRSDQFSLGVIAYQMLTGKLPYGTQVAKCKTRADQKKLRYHSIREKAREFPVWIDEAIRKAVHPDPTKRYEELSEFLFDLHHPNPAFLHRSRQPLLERDPVGFWKGVSVILAIIIAVLLRHGTPFK
jgi:serine/threonine protein phosphatase PrpC/predicted Ser/Thr protein kinase